MADVTRLLGLVADPPGGPLTPPPVGGLLHRARRQETVRRSAGVIASVLAVVAVAVPVALANRSQPGPPALAPTLPVSEGATAAALAAGLWRDIPPAPIEGRSYATSAWTGNQLLIWGGLGADGSTLLDDGASWDPAPGRWEVLPGAPLQAVTQPQSVWTGTEWVVVGGQGPAGAHVPQMAAYRPETATWRTVDLPSSRYPTAGTALVWTGRSVVVLNLGNSRRFGKYAPAEVHSWDPASSAWTQLPDLPSPAAGGQMAATWDGDAVVVVGTWEVTTPTTDGSSTRAGVDVHRLGAKGHWDSRPAEPGFGARQLLATTSGVLVPATPAYTGDRSGPIPRDLRGWRLEGLEASRLPHGPADDLGGHSVWTGAALVTANTGTYTAQGTKETFPGAAAAFAPGEDRWSALPAAPAQGIGAVVAWAGDRLVVWGLLYDVADLRPDGSGPAPVARSRGIALMARAGAAPTVTVSPMEPTSASAADTGPCGIHEYRTFPHLADDPSYGAEEYVGLSQDEAWARAQRAKLTVRLIGEDGRCFDRHDDHQSRRVNLYLESGRVAAAARY